MIDFTKVIAIYKADIAISALYYNNEKIWESNIKYGKNNSGAAIIHLTTTRRTASKNTSDNAGAVLGEATSALETPSPEAETEDGGKLEEDAEGEAIAVVGDKVNSPLKFPDKAYSLLLPLSVAIYSDCTGFENEGHTDYTPAVNTERNAGTAAGNEGITDYTPAVNTERNAGQILDNDSIETDRTQAEAGQRSENAIAGHAAAASSLERWTMQIGDTLYIYAGDATQVGNTLLIE